jgi:hypothetical protein
MSNLSNISPRPLLPDYAVGAFQQNTRVVGEFIAPTVTVPTQMGRYKKWTEKARFHVPLTMRGISGAATEISTNASDQNYDCVPNALNFTVDQSLGKDADLLARDAIDLLSDIYGLAHLYETLLKAKGAVGAGTDVIFDPAVDPIDLIDGQIEAVLLAGKCEEAGVLVGAKAWRRLKNHPAVAARRQILKWETNPTLFTANAQYMGCFAVIDNAPEGSDPVMEFLLQDEILIFGRHPVPNRRDPSFMKTFRTENYIQNVRTVESKDGRKLIVMLDWSAEIHVTNSTAAQRINYLPIS